MQDHQLIPVLEFSGQEGIQGVSARALYVFLTGEENYHNFSRWAETFITANEFAVRGEDWVCVDGYANPQGGRPSLDYHLRLDFAKHVALQARSQKGMEVRAYFIAVEKEARVGLPALNDPSFLRKALITYCERVETAEALLVAQAPLVAYAEKVQASPTSFPVDTTAKELGFPVVAFRTFVQGKYLFRRGRDWLPREEYGPNGKGWFEIRTRTYEAQGQEVAYHTTTVTGEGRIKLKAAFERSHQPQVVEG